MWLQKKKTEIEKSIVVCLQVSDFVGTFQAQQPSEEDKSHLVLLKYCPELNQVIGEVTPGIDTRAA